MTIEESTVETELYAASPFHAGERQLQALVGKRERVEQLGQRVIRAFLPDQHRTFFTGLHFIVVGSVANDGWPWASLLSGQPGFITSPEATRLRFAVRPARGDPLRKNLRLGAALGMLGIDLRNRRRNRMNGRVTQLDAHGFETTVDQSFGNCPQYIHTRTVHSCYTAKTIDNTTVEQLHGLDAAAQSQIALADTLFVSSYVTADAQPQRNGVDVSHRGGKRGFVKVDGDRLTIPDFAGNNHFNTLGNFLLNPKAGIVFPDFKTGTLLQLSGTVTLLDAQDPEVRTFEGAARAWRFEVQQAQWLRQSLAFRAEPGEASPMSAKTGSWHSLPQAIGGSTDTKASAH